MKDASVAAINHILKRYYAANASKVPIPSKIEQREFGYQPLNSGWIRHLGIEGNELARILESSVPVSVYCSAAYYEKPAARPMAAKGWIGTDLIFDIDAKDIGLDCRGSHSVTTCKGCGKALAEKAECCAGKQTTVSLPCDKCIAAARKDADAIVDMAVSSFCADPGTIRTYFSGNEGFHVHVLDTKFHGIGSDGRNILVRHAEKDGIHVDACVTTDMSRIFRMPGTLSNKSCLAKTECKNPFKDAVVLGMDVMPVLADCPTRFTLNGTAFGPYESETADVPEYAAAYMIMKGLAEPA